METTRKAATPPSPSSPPPAPNTPQATKVPGIRNSTCFNCKKQGHWAKECPSKTSNKSQPAASGGDLQHPTIYCPCGAGRCVRRLSGTVKNPGRWFYVCPVRGTGQCNFFKWCDRVTEDDIKLCPSTFPECPCGAGICRKIKETSGPNAGHSCFICPIKEGFGACSFIHWEKAQVDTQVKTNVGEHVLESKGYGSPQSTCDRHQVFDLGKIDDSSLEQSETMEIVVPEVENPQDFASFVPMPVSSAEDDIELTERRINDQTSDISFSNLNSSPCVAPDSGSSTVMSTIGDLFMQEAESLNSMRKKKASRVFSLMSVTKVHCRQIEFWRHISVAEDISAGGLHMLGWLGRLAFPPPRYLKDYPPKPFFCGIFPNFDLITVPQDENMLNPGGSTPLLHHPCAELDNLSSQTPWADCQLWNGLLWKPSGLKRSFATVQSDILNSLVSESIEWTSTPIKSLEQAAVQHQKVLEQTAVQYQKVLEQTALHFQNVFVSILNAIDPSDHNTLMMVANKYFSYLDHLQLPIDYEPFSRRVGEYIESASRLAGIEQSLRKECSLEELTKRYNSEKVWFDDISKVHDEAIAAFTNSSWRHQSLQEEASRVRAMLLQIENQLSRSKIETSELKARVDEISKDMLESKKRVDEAEETLKLREQREEELCAAKAALEQISWSMKRGCGLHPKKRQNV